MCRFPHGEALKLAVTSLNNIIKSELRRNAIKAKIKQI